MNYSIFVGGENDQINILRDLNELSNVKIIQKSNLFNVRILSVLFQAHYSQKLNKRINMPFKSLWYRQIIKKALHNNSEKTVFVFYPGWYEKKFIRWIQNEYPEVIRILYFRDTIKCYADAIQTMNPDNLKREFDYVLCYNPDEVQRYGITYASAYFSKLPLYLLNKNFPHYDVSFVGLAKDRLELLRNIYVKLNEYGISCRFIVAGVPKKERLNDGLEYIDKNISYINYLNVIYASDVILEILKKDTKGATLRCWEAVYYNKKLLTNWRGIEEFQFYDPSSMMYFETVDDISFDFFKSAISPEYNYAGENSPLMLLKQITNLIDNNR